MRTLSIAAITVLLVVLVEGAWWASKNRPHPTAGKPSPQLLSPIPKRVLVPANLSQASAPAATGAMAVSTATSTATTTSAETEQRLGPFSIAGADYTVVLKKKKCLPGSMQAGADTVVAMEIRDAAGNILYQKTFPYQTANTEFSDAWFVSAGILAGANGTGLLVSYDLDSEPSAPEPDSSGWYQVFGVVDGKFRPFSGPILVQGSLMSSDSSNKQFKTAGPLDSHSDALKFKVWAHHFRLIYPVRVDWKEGKLSPAQACDKAAGSSSLCRYAVAPEDDRRAGDLTFVQLCPDASPCDRPERALVKKDSKLELLGCEADVKWSEGRITPPTGNDPMDDQGGIGVGLEHLELMVRIDGKEGWMRTDEDFTALGLPFEQ
jgi:hypothetical protein